MVASCLDIINLLALLLERFAVALVRNSSA